MTGGINHVAIAVPDLERASEAYRSALGASVSKPMELPEHGVSVVFVELSNSKIELMAPLGDSSPIAGFLERNPAGGIHHICIETPDIGEAAKRAECVGRILAGGKPAPGAHGKPVIFLHPKDFCGALIELEEA